MSDRWYSPESVKSLCKYRDDKIAELERENEQLRKCDIRNYIPHPDEWSSSDSYVYIGLVAPTKEPIRPSVLEELTRISRDEARELFTEE